VSPRPGEALQKLDRDVTTIVEQGVYASGSGQRCSLSGWSYQTYCSVVVAVMPNSS